MKGFLKKLLDLVTRLCYKIKPRGNIIVGVIRDLKFLLYRMSVFRTEERVVANFGRRFVLRVKNEDGLEIKVLLIRYEVRLFDVKESEGVV